ncbi:MAG: phosphodiester glycosidase family protein [Clostridia bacterium]|nr:phosphodiester glycosidase family protein [Clostridia bacterium]
MAANAVILAVTVLFSGFILLDAFVIPHYYGEVEITEPNQTDTRSPETSSAGPDITEPAATDAVSSRVPENTGASSPRENSDTYYSDGNFTVEILEYREYNTDIYVADIRLSSLDYLKTAFANNAYGRNVTAKVSSIASSVGAVVAINGDYYGARNSGFVVRGGVIYRSSSSSNEALAIFRDGSFGFYDERKTTAKIIVDSGARDVFSFGPGIIWGGQVIVSANSEVGHAMASNPRTAIGKYDDGLHYVFVVSDGRVRTSSGLTLYQLAMFMRNTLGVDAAKKIEGGGASTMVFRGRIINNPTTNGGIISERAVSDIVYVG